jgi:hypothetical protein
MWKQINGYPNYSVSTEGEVKNNKTGRVLKPFYDSNGYKLVALYRPNERKVKSVHILVAEAFVPNPENKPEVNHKDGNKKNCHKSNLEWCTHSENMLHSRQVLGNEHKREKHQIECVETGAIYPTAIAAARAVGSSSIAIRKCLYGWTKTAAGLHWRYCYDYENRSYADGEGYDLWLCKSRWDEYFGVPEEESVAEDGELAYCVDAMC